ncbi:MAG: malate dehydrogenase [Candidatus Coatesbacteria bacterium]
MKRAKVAVIGAGNVGATVAARLVADEVGDVVLVDVIEGMPQGKALDLAEATPVGGTSVDVSGSNDYGAIEGVDAVVITAGIARKPGMSRDDLLATNAGIVKSAAEQVRAKAPGAFVVVVSNPLDVMTYLAWKVTGFPRARVFGMAGVLDSTRFAYFVSRELGVAARDVAAMVLGGHGDTMVPLPRYTTVSGIPITDLLAPEAIARLVARTRDGGAEIVALLKQGSAFYAPGASAAAMVKSLLRDEKRLLPAAAILEGEFGEHDVCLGVPLVIGAGGAERIVELKLTHEEKAALRKSADAVREGIGVLKSRGVL